MEDSKKLWRSLGELSGKTEQEFEDRWNRRQFLSLSATSIAAMGLASCSRVPLQKMLPYVQTPEGLVAGNAQSYSSGWSIGGQNHGLLVTCEMGRPIKIDGHPLHPASLGKATSLHQSLLVSLYDEKRLRKPRQNTSASSWESFNKEIQSRLPELQKNLGRGTVFLTEISNSPTLNSQFEKLQKLYPHLQWIQYEPLSLERSQQAAHNLWGGFYSSVYDLKRAQVAVCFDADIFGSPLYPLRYTHDFFESRSQETQNPALLFVAEPTPSITGAWTPLRLRLRGSQIPHLCRTLYDYLLAKEKPVLSSQESAWILPLHESILKNAGRAVFFAGPSQPIAVHELCHELNTRYGKELVAYRAQSLKVSNSADLAHFSLRLERGEIDSLFVLGGNPSFQSPPDLQLDSRIKKAKHSYHFSLYQNETSTQCKWTLPLAHPFETWSDAEAFDGTWSLQQPLIAPLFEGKSELEILELFLGKNTSAHDLIKDLWTDHLQNSSWEACVQRGVLEKKPSLTKTPKMKPASTEVKAELALTASEVEIIFRGDPHLWDGRFSGNAWLQELPKPLTQLSWGNAALISPALASERNISMGQVLKLSNAAGSMQIPAYILPGQEDRTVTLHFGHGDLQSQRLEAQGFNVFKLWGSTNPDWMPGQLELTSEKMQLACTQTHHSMQGSEPVREVKNWDEKIKPSSESASLFPQDPFAGETPPEAWAMVIDLDHCIGCNACVSACQSENNIPVVGREGVLRGREMHWIRIDRYFSGSVAEGRTLFQPVPCMQCEKAPCEEVCPVAATTHSTDGLNQMVYNRCVGTRYCANNCPYKVRRFNYFSYTSNKGELHKFIQNPDVSVRPRGVMEKCTYCVQRIEAARIHSLSENRSIADGEVKPACQVTCPTEAIIFGNKKDPKSKVSSLREKGRHYVLLEELGTRPRTTYLAKVSDAT